jgi:hypothetical protein
MRPQLHEIYFITLPDTTIKLISLKKTLIKIFILKKSSFEVAIANGYAAAAS